MVRGLAHGCVCCWLWCDRRLPFNIRRTDVSFKPATTVGKRRELERTNSVRRLRVIQFKTGRVPRVPRVLHAGAEHLTNLSRPQIFNVGLPLPPLFTELLVAVVGLIFADSQASFVPFFLPNR